MFYNLEGLKKTISDGIKWEGNFFWKNLSCLSQWYIAPFRFEGQRFKTAEQYMMYEKARLFGDVLVAAKILKAKDPRKAKELGRQVKGFKEHIWASKRFGIVVDGNLAKFSQNKKIKKYLLSTKPKVLVEASPYDKIWGIGLSEDNAWCCNPFKWRGTNLLGFALMEVRDILEQEK
jgi:ribA/ribD-fused uncharacterized protein